MNLPKDTWAAAACRLWNAAVTYRRAIGTFAPPCGRSARPTPRCCIDAPTQRLVTIQDLSLVRVLFYAALRHSLAMKLPRSTLACTAAALLSLAGSFAFAQEGGDALAAEAELDALPSGTIDHAVFATLLPDNNAADPTIVRSAI